MRPLFTLHAGEYLVASEIERRFRRVNVWVPSKDTGVDLLVSDRRGRRTVSLQVKFSRDWLVTHGAPEFQKSLRASGWWTIDQKKLARSLADYWVLVLQGFANRTVDFVVVPLRQLAKRLTSLHGRDRKVHMYLSVTEDGRCWETRGTRKTDQRRMADGAYVNGRRDFTRWLDNWEPVLRLNRG